MSVVTRWLAGRRPRAEARHHYLRRHLGPPAVAVDLGNVQPIVSEIDSNGVRFVGLVLECANVIVRVRVEDPAALRSEAWQEINGPYDPDALVWRIGLEAV